MLHTYKGNCTKKEAVVCCQMSIQYLMFKIHKNPIVGKPIVAGYNWVLTPASIFVGHHLKEFYSEFENILTDSLSMVKMLET